MEKEKKFEFNSFDDDFGMWAILLLAFMMNPSYTNIELEKRVAKLEGKLETIEKIIT